MIRSVAATPMSAEINTSSSASSGLDVNRPRTSLRLVGLADEVFEAIDDLLLGAGKTVAEPAEDTHLLDLIAV